MDTLEYCFVHTDFGLCNFSNLVCAKSIPIRDPCVLLCALSKKLNTYLKRKVFLVQNVRLRDFQDKILRNVFEWILFMSVNMVPFQVYPRHSTFFPYKPKLRNSKKVINLRLLTVLSVSDIEQRDLRRKSCRLFVPYPTGNNTRQAKDRFITVIEFPFVRVSSSWLASE